jgi:hypothetical protein
MVAMSGQIMPAPLAMPVRVAVRPATSNRRETSLGTVSVVMMARAARGQPSGSSRATRVGRAAAMRPTGRCSPITPVEKGSTCSGLPPVRSATAWQLASASASPRGPVPALALPELISHQRGAAAAGGIGPGSRARRRRRCG